MPALLGTAGWAHDRAGAEGGTAIATAAAGATARCAVTGSATTKTRRRAGGTRSPRAAKTGPGKAAPKLVGSEVPRLFTPPLRRLTRHTSLGFECIEFAETMLGAELLPWHKWWLKHALELDRNGDFRYRVIVTLVARQNGKTFLMIVVALWMLYMGRARLVLGSAQSLDTAREAWSGAVEWAEGDAELAAEIDAVRQTNGEQTLKLTTGARYKIVASTRKAGRGLSVDLLLLDELREHRDWLAWAALSKTTSARPCALTLGFSNAGDDDSVVLNQLRETALAGGDPTLAVFEWSGEYGCELDDRKAMAQANPGLGHVLSERALMSALSTDPPAVFRTEVLCQHVDQLDGAISLGAWRNCADPSATMDELRDQVVLCVDVAPDGQHATAVAAATTPDGRVRVEVVESWTGTDEARQALAVFAARVKPAAVVWFPSGPAAALGTDLRALSGVDTAPPREGTPMRRRPSPLEVVELTGTAVSEACQAFADLVTSGRVVHNNDPLLSAHVAGASKLYSGDGWRFTRRGVGHVDAVYAAAGAVHVARSLPPVKARQRVRVV